MNLGQKERIYQGITTAPLTIINLAFLFWGDWERNAGRKEMRRISSILSDPIPDITNLHCTSLVRTINNFVKCYLITLNNNQIMSNYWVKYSIIMWELTVASLSWKDSFRLIDLSASGLVFSFDVQSSCFWIVSSIIIVRTTSRQSAFNCRETLYRCLVNFDIHLYIFIDYIHG